MQLVHFRDRLGERRIGSVAENGEVYDVVAVERYRLEAQGFSAENASNVSAHTFPRDFGEFVARTQLFPDDLQSTGEYFRGSDRMNDEALHAAGALFAQTDVEFLPPIGAASNIICIGQNYTEHLKETGHEIPKNPSLFLRTHGSVVGHHHELIRPSVSECLDWEGELAVVIGRPGRYIPSEKSIDFVAGYTIFNDGSIRDYQVSAPTPTAGKNFHHTGSCGPFFVSKDQVKDPQNLSIKTWIDDEVVQDGNTDGMVVGIADLIAYISKFIWLQPGDLIVTGTPAGVGYRRNPPRFLVPGQQLRIEIEGLGALSNVVVDERP